MFGQRLRELREESGYSRERLADLLEIGSASVARYERGENITGDILAKIARFFNVTTDYLLGLSDSRTEQVANLEPKEKAAIAAWRRGEKYEAIKEIVDDE